jgi:flagellar biosynthesis protein FlhG
MLGNTTIIPVASGKGGVGKSLIAANLSMALARLGHETVAVDLDLGGSNLHSYFGLPNKFPGIGDYLKGGRSDLENLLIKTDIEHALSAR